MRQQNLHTEAKLAVIAQICVVASMFPLIWALTSPRGALSFLLGGIIIILPNFYLLRKFFSQLVGKCPRRILGVFFRGQAVKWMLVASGFLLATQIAWILPLLLFFGFISAQIAFGLLPLIWAMKKRRVTRIIEIGTKAQ